ncbi:restriction endonuclease subunit S [Xanthomonas campestris pv. lawsoniae]|uniref:restriction endonuclease subunit S n=1 Tax=Xanthomonas euvesicatoria TaxID=456327 RepID=UPI001C46EA10|nr:restriction endonuclease subunit S [Xanthomonas campestris pv. lawsoniae]
MSELPSGWSETEIGPVNTYSSETLNPAKAPKQTFELYSVPVFAKRKPEIVDGKDIGSTKQKVEPDDVLLCKINPRINRVWLVGKKNDHEQIASSEWIVIRQPLFDPAFIRFQLQESSFRDRLCAEVSGVGGSLTRAQPKKVESYKLRIAPLAEQKRIAQKLDALLAQVDTLKARIDAIPALLKRFRQSVLESAFSGELTAEWRQLHPDTKAASITDVRQAWRDHYQRSGRKFVTPNLDPTNLRDDLPPTWQATQIGIIFDVFVGATPARDRTDFWKGSISWVSSAEVAFCKIRSTKEKITEAGYRATSTNLHPPGTVMLAMIGQGKTRGQPAILAIDACHNQNTAALRVHDEYGVPEYLYYYLWGKYEETRRFGGGNNQQALNKKSVQSLPFPLAPLAEQTEIVRRVEQLFAYADQLEAKVATAQQRIDALTQCLLAKAFRGELVPQDPGDEPASVLLERIRTQRAATPKPKRGRKAATS